MFCFFIRRIMDDAVNEDLRMIHARWLARLAETQQEHDNFNNSVYLRDVIVAEYGEIPHPPRYMLSGGEVAFMRGELRFVPNTNNLIAQNWDFGTPLVKRDDVSGGVYWYVYNNKNEAAVIDCEGITHKFPIKQLIVRPDDIDHVVARNMNIQNE